MTFHADEGNLLPHVHRNEKIENNAKCRKGLRHSNLAVSSNC